MSSKMKAAGITEGRLQLLRGFRPGVLTELMVVVNEVMELVEHNNLKNAAADEKRMTSDLLRTFGKKLPQSYSRISKIRAKQNPAAWMLKMQHRL
ncbi:hypothetical protein Q3G72_008313 [Acer saccharum]|nr:hypothetical protein Q3G72_008313 [Acer saccharum]